MNICTKFHDNLSDSCWGVIWTKVVLLHVDSEAKNLAVFTV